jgi:hypothetical protein
LKKEMLPFDAMTELFKMIKKVGGLVIGCYLNCVLQSLKLRCHLHLGTCLNAGVFMS